MNEPEPRPVHGNGRIPTLDGIRAVSIGLVLVAHSLGTGSLPMSDRLSRLLGDLGVRAFFVLSGFLITTLLIRERERNGFISLRAFYLRRVFRIFPAFYAFLLVAGLLAVFGLIRFSEGDLMAAASYLTNFHGERSWWTGHLWSLSVEEQFYVVWPVLLTVLGLTRGLRAAVVAVALAPLARLAVWTVLPEHRDLADQAFPCVFDAIATGCILAFAMPKLRHSARCQRFLDGSAVWALALLAIALKSISNPWIELGIATSVANIAFAAVLLRCVARPDSRVSRALETPALAWLGTLSYSLYLWQQLFLNRHSAAWIHQFPLNLLGAFAAAITCHYLIERPFLRMTSRRRTASSAGAASEAHPGEQGARP